MWKISPTMITTNREIQYTFINEEDVLEDIKKTTKRVNEVLSLPSTTIIRLILNYFKWDVQNLEERFFDDSEKLFEELNVANPYLSPSLQTNPLSPPCYPTSSSLLSSNANLECRTCCSVQTPDQIYSLRCRHQHCLTCWEHYLESNIIANGYQQCIYCPSRCNQVIDDDEILRLLSSNKRLLDRYRRLLIDSYVETNRLTQWCPGNACTNIVKLKTYSRNCSSMIECDNCKMVFCFKCTKQWHEPIECSLLKKWEAKNQDESMTGKWIIANTKECPGCKSSIEKNGGCNHMTCRKPGCGHEFCWICFADWNTHNTQQCNVYQENREELSEAREVLARYIHYYTRYETHNQSLELESNLLSKVNQIILSMQIMNSTAPNATTNYTDQQAIRKAFDVLQNCRRILKYTYPFAYFLKRNNQSEIFEQNQADLERSTESLSEFLENKVEFPRDVVLDLMNKTSYCDQRQTVLVNYCKAGYKDNCWEFTV